eukprot:UN17680
MVSCKAILRKRKNSSDVCNLIGNLLPLFLNWTLLYIDFIYRVQ